MSDESISVLTKIRELGWWQGSVIVASDLAGYIPIQADVDFWVITSQTCNLYNYSFDKVPNFELVGARRIEKCLPGFSKGDHPRALHVEAIRPDETISLEINILQRQWLDRSVLSNLPPAYAEIVDSIDSGDPDFIKKQWLDKFSGWLARSYTRVTLPDQFNQALSECKLKSYIEEKLAANSNQLYGIYFSLSPDSDDEFAGALGLMPPPYALEIVIVCHGDVDPEPLKSEIVKKIFDDEVKVKGGEGKKTMAKMAEERGIRMSRQGIIARTTDDITLKELRSLTRYSFVDHLSDSSYSHSE
ncbi:hypothetical protein [Pseudomonas sp. BN102]|uniref:hypothetical protein n=1 Tax=Pseudomonas sp. BN102 TaxID=2567886 RepID=UPI0024579A66|nr:hypothetical protein [Pseudomonas sp. BN102]MDH4610309.1 hypothetical protein [Pseudomonas sp. BN102]